MWDVDKNHSIQCQNVKQHLKLVTERQNDSHISHRSVLILTEMEIKIAITKEEKNANLRHDIRRFSGYCDSTIIVLIAEAEVGVNNT